MPNQPKTKGRMFRIPDELYAAAQAEAQERGETLTDVVRAALREYVSPSHLDISHEPANLDT